MGSKQSSEEERQASQDFVESEVKNHKVVVFSKRYCPYCTKAKNALKEVGADFHVVELELRSDGGVIQDILLKMTGGRTVPRVFIDGKFIGGGTETQQLAESGELKKLLEA